MPSNYFECCSRVNPMDSVPEALYNTIIYNKKQDDEIAKKANKDDLSEVAKSGRYNDLIDKPIALPNPKPITINGQSYDGSEEVTVTVSGEGVGTPVEIDDTLTQSGKAADAKAVGDQLSALNEAIDKKWSSEVLWENAAPNSAFDEQAITFDWKGYNYCMIYFLAYVGTGLCSFSAVAKKGDRLRFYFLTDTEHGAWLLQICIQSYACSQTKGI